MSAAEGQVLRSRLRNGLEVRLKEIHSSPLISFWIWYRVGSRNERPGTTGCSHWVEHMLFKGTPKFPANVLDRAISRDGGYWNAFTWMDFTTYFETLPEARIDLALELESDRMVNSTFEEKLFESERTVIIAEREGHENEPAFRLSEEVQSSAFRVHPYHHEVIGDMADLHTMRRDDLYQHYRRFYIPRNAIVAVAGDFRARTMLKKIREHFGGLEGGSAPEHFARPEPPQRGEKRVTVEGPGETPYLRISYHAPPARHPDFFPLAVLDSVLSGASNLNMFGSGISNKTSRLYKALVETGLAASVSGGLAATADPFLYTVGVTVRPDQDPEATLARFDEEVARMLDQPIGAREAEKANKQARALFAYGSESITNQAFWLGYSEIFDNYDWFEGYLDRLRQVGAEDVLSVARRYLIPSNRVVGVYRPVKENGDA
jgi:zinc protease